MKPSFDMYSLKIYDNVCQIVICLNIYFITSLLYSEVLCCLVLFQRKEIVLNYDMIILFLNSEKNGALG